MINHSLQGHKSRRKGAVGEEIADILLRSLGVKMVEKIATPVKIVAKRKGGWVKIIWGNKVSGDRTGIMPDGTRVLAEVKVRDRNLRWSDLKPHQRRALDNNHANNGISLLVWIHTDDNMVLSWPIEGFGQRKSITLKRGQEWHDLTVRWMQVRD